MRAERPELGHVFGEVIALLDDALARQVAHAGQRRTRGRLRAEAADAAAVEQAHEKHAAGRRRLEAAAGRARPPRALALE